MDDTRKTVVFQSENFELIESVRQKEGFNFSQAVNWILRKYRTNQPKEKGTK